MAICLAIFLVVFSLIVYVAVRFRSRPGDDGREPAQVYGSVQVELAWTVIPVLIVVVLFLTTARIIFAIQDAPEPRSALDVTVVGHQFWWEFRYPALGIVTANELHVPASSAGQYTPTYLRLLSADVDHSFWVPQLAGKTDLIPNHPNQMWIDPRVPGLYLGQCAQFCGVEHAKMLLRVDRRYARGVPTAGCRRRRVRPSRSRGRWRRAGACLNPMPASTATRLQARWRMANSVPT